MLVTTAIMSVLTSMITKAGVVATTTVAAISAFVHAFKEYVRSDQELNNLITDLMKRKQPPSTLQKGSICARITVYAENYPSVFGVKI